MDRRATYTEDDVVLTDQLPAKAASPRPVTAADLIPGAGPSSRPSPATVHGVAPPTTGGLRSSSSSTSVVGAGGVPYPSAGSSSMPPVSANTSILLPSASSGPAKPASTPSSPSKDSSSDSDEEDELKFTPVDDDADPARRKIRSHRPRFSDPDEYGWSTSHSRKFHMARGAHPDEPVPEQPAKPCTNEVPWGVWFGGDLRKIKKWHQGRVTGTRMTKAGMGIRTYGTYGPDGFES